jgi:uncharacterized membrane protein YebE (DUF533 family)
VLRTLQATVDEKGNVTLNEPLTLPGRTRALVTLLEEPEDANEAYLLAQSALEDGWSGRDEDEAWKHLADLPELEDKQR